MRSLLNLFAILFCAVFVPLTAATPPKVLLEIKSNAAIIAVDYSPDGKRIVTGGQTNEVAIWDAQTGKPIMVLKGHTDNVVAVKYSPNSRYIVSGGVDNKMILWDAITGEIIYKHAVHRDYVRHVAFSPDSKYMASASWDGTANVWTVLSGEIVTSITAHLDNVTSVDFSADGSELLTSSGDKTIRVWDTKTWQQKYLLQGHTDEVWDARFSPNGKYICSGAWDNTARVWSTAQRKEIFTFKAHTSDVWTTVFSPDNQLMVSGGGDRKVKVWDMATGEMVCDLAGDLFTAEVENVVFSPDGKSIAAVSRDGYCRVFATPMVAERRAAFLDNKMSAWSKKGAFEKTEDFQRRIEKKAKQESQFSEDFDRQCTDYFTQNVNWQKLELGEYDADREEYRFNSPHLGKLRVRVQPKEAPAFAENFGQVQFISPKFKMTKEAVELDHAELHIPRGTDTKAYLLVTNR
jgi:WD domain, G-beta repeat